MRQVFTSARLENVEAVADLLRAEGIEVKISNDRSYRGNRRSNFSYRERGDAASHPAVWIVRAEDQPRGRQLLRDAGLLDSSRDGTSSYLSTAALHDGQKAAAGTDAGGKRIKLGLLLLIGVVIVLAVFGARKFLPAADEAPAIAAPARPAPPPVIPEAVQTLQVYRADMPTALAAHLASDAITSAKPARACISVDGADPTAAVLQAIAAGNTQVAPASTCGDAPALKIAVSTYMTDGSGSGTAQRSLDGGAAEELQVSRDGTRWRIER